jgi:hypothetical protein
MRGPVLQEFVFLKVQYVSIALDCWIDACAYMLRMASVTSQLSRDSVLMSMSHGRQ